MIRSILVVASVVVVAVSSSGCGATGGHPDYPAHRPFPIAVGVYFDEAGSVLPAGSVVPESSDPDEPTATQSTLRFTRDASSVLAAFVDDLAVRAPVVAHAEALEARTLAGALREGMDLDYIVGLRLVAPSECEYEISTGLAAVEIFSWLFGGIPSWFVPSRDYVVDSEMALQVSDMNHRDVQAWLRSREGDGAPGSDFELVAKRARTGMSLHDRSPIGGDGALEDGALDYVLTIVIPPLAVDAENSDVASDSLTAKLCAELHNQLEPALRAELVAREIDSPLRIVFGDAPIDANGIFKFDLISDGASKLKALDVHRIAEKESGEPHYRWEPTDEQLAQLDEALSAGDPSSGSIEIEGEEGVGGGVTGRLPVELADLIPLVPGRNILKVRVLREDGVRTSRSWVVFVGEEK